MFQDLGRLENQLKKKQNREMEPAVIEGWVGARLSGEFLFS